MKMIRQDKLKVAGVIFVSLVVYIFIVAKASVASFTHDESYSYLHFIGYKFMDIISNQGAFSNNHILNTLGMKYASQFFGSSEIALRAPNLIALVIYFIYGWLLVRSFSGWQSISVYTLLITNVALIDFFGLARGYGLSIGFMFMSLYHLNASFSGKMNLNLALFNSGSLLAILGNFTMVIFYFSGLLIFNVIAFLELYKDGKKIRLFRLNKVNIIAFFILLIILYEPIRKAVKFNTFDFGGKNGFITDTVSSLIYHIFMNIHFSEGWMVITRMALLLIVFMSLMIIIFNLVRRGKAFLVNYRKFIITNLLLISISFATILQHLLFSTDYLVGRFSLFLVPLLILNTGYLLDYLSGIRPGHVISGAVVILALLSVFNFYRNADLHACAEWRYDQGTRNAMKELAGDQQKDQYPLKKVRLGVNWLFEPTCNFYRITMKIRSLYPIDRKGLSTSDRYNYIFMVDSGSLVKKPRQLMYHSPGAGTGLWKIPDRKN